MDSNANYFGYWGKAEDVGDSFHLLVYHCLDVAAIAHTLLNNNNLIVNRLQGLTLFPSETILRWATLGAGFHELGKFSESFQSLLPELLYRLQGRQGTRPYSVRHDSLGFLLWDQELCIPEYLLTWFNVPTDEVNHKKWRRLLTIFGKAVTGHHGVPPRKVGRDNLPLQISSYFAPTDIAAARRFGYDFMELLNEVYEEPQPPVYSKDLRSCMVRASWFIAGLVVFCDWVGSNSRWFPFVSKPMSLETYWMDHAIPAAEKALRETTPGAQFPDEEGRFADIFPAVSRPSPMQIYVSGCKIPSEPQLFIIEDTTGSGKTEAALFLAHRLMSRRLSDGFFVALPTMATSNAMYDRITGIYRKLFNSCSSPYLILTHSARHLSKAFASSIVSSLEIDTTQGEMIEDETATAQCTTWLADNRKKALLADAGVGTLDQALLAIMPSRFQSLRLFGLSRHILIVDEVHAYDPYMNKLLQTLIYFHSALGGNVILLSATLPMKVRQEMIDSFADGQGINIAPTISSAQYPLATHYSLRSGIAEISVGATNNCRKEMKIEIIVDKGDVIRLLSEASRQGKCACWICNTVHDALTGYKELLSTIGAEDLLLFHARFTMGDRLDIENRVLATFGKHSAEGNRRGKVLVATQVVEQSLDLDFDMLISDLAPIDLLIQRAGRLHRHVRDAKGNPLLGPETKDLRESPCLYLHAPIPGDDSGSDWYEEMFPKGSYVYPNHGCLWLTARLLKDKGRLKIPDDSRELIEAVFSGDADSMIPQQLFQRDLEAYAKWQADRSLAHINMLKLEEGYSDTPNQWLHDMQTPTRLGAIDSTVRLARWDGKKLVPWYDSSDFPWDMSQVSIHSGLVSTEVDHEKVLAEVVNKLKEGLPDRGKWSILVLVEQSEDGTWQGFANDRNGKPVTLVYERTLGLSVLKTSKKER